MTDWQPKKERKNQEKKKTVIRRSEHRRVTGTTSGASTTLYVAVCVGRRGVQGELSVCVSRQPVISWHKFHPETLEALSRAPLYHLKVVSKKKKLKVIWVCKRGRSCCCCTPPQIYMLEHNYVNCECQRIGTKGCLSLYVCL